MVTKVSVKITVVSSCLEKRTLHNAGWYCWVDVCPRLLFFISSNFIALTLSRLCWFGRLVDEPPLDCVRWN